MSALRRMRETDRPIAFKPWIYEIAKNACIDQFRRSRRAEEVSYDADEGLGSADYGRLVTKDPAPEAAFETKQQLDQLRGAFGGLSETHHEILVMRELEGLSYREIGERLGMTRPAVESTLFRARRRLTEEYEQLVTGERCQRVQAIIADRRRGRARRARPQARRPPRLLLPAVPAPRARCPASTRRTWSTRRCARRSPRCCRCRRSSRSRIAGAALARRHASRRVVVDAAGTVDPGVAVGWGKAAATAATIAIAGVGASVATRPAARRAALDGRSARRAPDRRPIVGARRRHGAAAARAGRRRGPAPATASGSGLSVAAQRRRRATRRARRLGQRASGGRLAAASSGRTPARLRRARRRRRGSLPVAAAPRRAPTPRPTAARARSATRSRARPAAGPRRRAASGRRRRQRRPARRRRGGSLPSLAPGRPHRPAAAPAGGHRTVEPGRRAVAGGGGETVDEAVTGVDRRRAGPAGRPVSAGEGDFLASLTDTSLYSIGAYFADRHPDLVDDVIAQSEDIEDQGLRALRRGRRASRSSRRSRRS